jgi:hypothetical protein
MLKCCTNVFLQAMSYEQAGRPRRVVRLQLVSPVSAAMAKLLAIKEGSDAASEAGLETAAEQGAHSAGSAPSRNSSSKGSERDLGGLTAEPSVIQEGPAARGKK